MLHRAALHQDPGPAARSMQPKPSWHCRWMEQRTGRSIWFAGVWVFLVVFICTGNRHLKKKNYNTDSCNYPPEYSTKSTAQWWLPIFDVIVQNHRTLLISFNPDAEFGSLWDGSCLPLCTLCAEPPGCTLQATVHAAPRGTPCSAQPSGPSVHPGITKPDKYRPSHNCLRQLVSTGSSSGCTARCVKSNQNWNLIFEDNWSLHS